MSELNDPQAPLKKALERLELDMGVSECHGHLVGWICASGESDADIWLQAIDKGGVSGDLLAEEARQLLRELFSISLGQLNDPELDFHPLLSAEDAGIEQRLHDLGEWVQGFLLGMSEGGVVDIDKLPADCPEIMKDLVEIAGVERYELSDGDEDESAYMELLEYIRTGVLLINEELHPTKAPPVDQQTLH